MKRICLCLAALSLSGCASVQRHQRPTPDYFGLTQAQLAAQVGFPLRVYTLPARALGGPGILFWVYYQKAANGAVEEKQFSFSGAPLKVNSVSSDIDPSRFLSLDDPRGFKDIYRYNQEHNL